MIICHEGMPRSGKSFAAFKDHILPALKAGRRVYARLDGLNYEKIAAVAGITEERCRELLIHLEESDISRLDSYGFENDALIVIDELQNYFPDQRQPLGPGMTKFITEHGHHGFDILIMGQVLKDCHKLWRNRTNRKLQFVKKDMLGKPDEYKWTMYTGSLDRNGNVKFTEVSKGDGVYEKEYFGCYKSHSDGTENKETYADDRVNIWKSPVFRRWIPALAIVVLIAVGYLVYLFKGGLVKEAPKEAKAKPVKVETVVISEDKTEKRYVDGRELAAAPKVEPPKPEAKDRNSDPFDMPDIVAELNKENRMRLGALIRSAKKTRVVVEWRDASQRLIESMTDDDLSVLGYQVMTTNANTLVMVVRADKRYIATAWPIQDAKGEVSEDQRNRVRGDSSDRPDEARRSPRYHADPPLGETSPVSAADAVPSKSMRFNLDI